jgi:SpoVK/Ycf46/Vps4 family AAA+-type ATPase
VRRIECVLREAVLFAPCIVVLDNIDVLAPTAVLAAASLAAWPRAPRSPARGTQEEGQPGPAAVRAAQIAEAVSDLLLHVASLNGHGAPCLAVVASARSAAAVHPVLRLPGAFTSMVKLALPDMAGRAGVLERLCERAGFPGSKVPCPRRRQWQAECRNTCGRRAQVNWAMIAAKTEGFSGRDLVQVVERATHVCAAGQTVLLHSDFLAALKDYVPVSLKGIALQARARWIVRSKVPLSSR